MSDLERLPDDGPLDETDVSLRAYISRIPAERLQDYVQRLEALTLAFSSEPRGGDVVYGMLVTVFATDRPGLKEPS